MKKTVLRLVALFGITSCMVLLSTHELRTPLGLNSRLNLVNGSWHYPLKPVEEESLWSFDVWGGGYSRRAHSGMCPKRCDWCCPDKCNSCYDDCCGSSSNVTYCGCESTSSNGCTTGSCCYCNSNCCNCCSGGCNDSSYGASGSCIGEEECDRKRASLAQLFFGKSEFRGEEAFANGIIVSNPTNSPGLSFAKLRPSFDYNERGVVLGMHIERRRENSKWRFGLNVSLPIKSIEVEQSLACGLEAIEDSIGDVIAYKREVLDETDGIGVPSAEKSYAYRLDFLSSLQSADGGSIVTYGDGSLRIVGVETAVNPAAQSNSIVAWKRDNGRVDLTEDFAAPRTFTAGGMGVPGAGNGTFANNTKRKFIDTQDYSLLGSDRDAQGKLFIVPVYNDQPGVETECDYMPNAKLIANVVDHIVSGMELKNSGSAIRFFEDNGICLCRGQHVTGQGDLDAAIYAGYDCSERSFGEFVLGLRFPTGIKNTNPLRVLYQPTGNNGHFEAKVGISGGWRTKSWIGLHFDASYSHVFEATEKKAAAFKCAKVKNIGPCIDARVKWGYFLGHFDMTIFHPENQNMGLSFGYEIYYKRRDCIKFVDCGCSGEGQCLSKFKDLIGAEQDLDPSLLAKNTNILTHKIRGQVFHRWNYFELYAGASRVIGGWNGMKETEAHIGFGIYF